MAITQRTRLINPRLGAYFSIFASAFAALFLTLLIFEQLGTSDSLIRATVLFLPLVVFCVIGIATYTRHPPEFFAAGRRVPAVYNGLVLAVIATGGTILIAATGLFFFNGFDAWALVIGITTGFVIMGTMVAPYLRKYGGYTVPSYLARRFQSRLLRVVSAAVFTVPILLMLTAELQMASYAASLLTGLSSTTIVTILGLTLGVTITFGGMRALGWVGTAQAIAVVLAIVVPAAMLGVIETNLPLAQFSYGPVLRGIGRVEVAQQIPVAVAAPLAFDLAGSGLTTIEHRLATPYGSLGPVSFALLTLTVALGIACAPWLLPRCGTTVGVYEARKSLGWTVFFVGIITLTLAALAIFMRSFVMNELVGQSVNSLPEWFATLAATGKAAVAGSQDRLVLSDFQMDRDSILFAVPIAAKFPVIVLYLTLAGAIAAAIAAAAATAYALATMLSEDIVHGLDWIAPKPSIRLGTARGLTVFAILAGLVFASFIRTDPLQLLLWSLSISASVVFPIVVMSLWWKQMGTVTAVAGLLVGFAGAVLGIVVGDSWLIPLPGPLMGLVGFVPAILTVSLVTVIGGQANHDSQAIIHDIRIPGGETVYDREERLAHLKEQKRNS